MQSFPGIKASSGATSQPIKEAVLAGVFPSSLYSAEDKQGVEFALGGQYTTNSFSVFGLEYYFQSEGYSKKAWQDQIDFIRLMGYRTGYDFFRSGV